MQKTFSLIVAASLCLPCLSAYAQDISSPLNKALDFPTRFFDKIQHQYAWLDNQLTRQTEKYLKHLEKQEERLNNKLSKIDPAKAEQLFASGQRKYAQLLNKIEKPAEVPSTIGGVYLPMVDSVKTSLAFLSGNNALLSNSKGAQEKLQNALSSVNELRSKLKTSAEIRAFIAQRKEQLTKTLQGYKNLPAGVMKNIQVYNKQAFYYASQVEEYKNELNEAPKKLIKKGLSMLDKLPAYQKFLKENGELASLFRLPANYGSMQSLAGLQTRAQVQGMIQAQLATGGPNATAMFTQNLKSAQVQLNKLKDKLKTLGNGSSDMDMPDFKPKNLKTKPFWKRLEYGANLQSSKSNYFIPAESDIGLSVGYKLSEKSTIGLGMAYKMGWGKDIQHITITAQGLDLRSYIDVRIKSSFYASGGFEYLYVKPFQDFRQLYDFNTWQRSALIGISKIVSLKSKWAKKTKLQLLYDMLYSQQVPRVGQPVKFRIGYSF